MVKVPGQSRERRPSHSGIRVDGRLRVKNRSRVEIDVIGTVQKS
jgi:hypothetical protein